MERLTPVQTRILNKTYRDLHSNAYMGSVSHLFRVARKLDPSLTRLQVKQWLLAQQSYALAPPLRYKREHEKINVHGVKELMAANLLKCNI